jgi:hypothetical protein
VAVKRFRTEVEANHCTGTTLFGRGEPEMGRKSQRREDGFWLSEDSDKARLRDAENARRNRAEITAALSHGKVSRRDLIRWGLFTTAGIVAPIGGLSPFVTPLHAAFEISRNMPFSFRIFLLGAMVSAIAASILFPFVPRVVATGPDNSHFPNIELITQDGRKVHFYDDLIRGKIVAIDLIYTSRPASMPARWKQHGLHRYRKNWAPG